MSALSLKKKYLIGFGSWLNEQSLSGAASRARTRMVEILVAAIETFNKDRDSIIDAVVNKEEDGKTWKKKPAVDNLPETWDIDSDKLAGLESSYQELAEEDFVLDVTEANRAVLKQTRDILLNTNYLFGPKEGDPAEERMAKIRQMNDYPNWCKPFESVDLDA